jgi:tetratricopeptide (TPR) repeat protein
MKQIRLEGIWAAAKRSEDNGDGARSGGVYSEALLHYREARNGYINAQDTAAASAVDIKISDTVKEAGMAEEDAKNEELDAIRSAAEISIMKGDKAFAGQEYYDALSYYEDAISKYNDAIDKFSKAADIMSIFIELNEKMDAAKFPSDNTEEQEHQATLSEEEGDRYFARAESLAAQNMSSAREWYDKAIASFNKSLRIYTTLKDFGSVRRLEEKIYAAKFPELKIQNEVEQREHQAKLNEEEGDRRYARAESLAAQGSPDAQKWYDDAIASFTESLRYYTLLRDFGSMRRLEDKIDIAKNPVSRPTDWIDNYVEQIALAKQWKDLAEDIIANNYFSQWSSAYYERTLELYDRAIDIYETLNANKQAEEARKRKEYIMLAFPPP